MKAKLPRFGGNTAVKKKVQKEIHKELVEANEEYELELDALVLWVLHSVFGFGHVRLSRFYDAVMRERKRLHDYYQPRVSDESDNDIEYHVAKLRLRDYGFDVAQEYRRLASKYKVRHYHNKED